ncbi:hypothetical protein D3C73_1334110 [compost metagenome]
MARQGIDGLLLECHGAEDPAVLHELGGNRGDTGSLQPLACPVRKVPAGGSAERLEEVLQGRIAELVIPKILT